MKPWKQSRTVWIESLQAVVGLLTGVILFLQDGLTPEALGALAVGMKGVYGIWLRFDTNEQIS